MSRLGCVKEIVDVLAAKCTDDKQRNALSEAIGYMKNNLNVNKVEYHSFYEFLGKEMTELCHELGFSNVKIFKDFRGKERFMNLKN